MTIEQNGLFVLPEQGTVDKGKRGFDCVCV